MGLGFKSVDATISQGGKRTEETFPQTEQNTKSEIETLNLKLRNNTVMENKCVNKILTRNCEKNINFEQVVIPSKGCALPVLP